MPQVQRGVAQEARLVGKDQEGLEHGQRQQLGVGELRDEPILGRLWRSSGRIRSASDLGPRNRCSSVSVAYAECAN